MRYFSTFTGIGGFEMGISRAIPTAECVGYSEVNRPAIQTYEEHYEHTNFGDITTIDPTGLPSFDLIVGGFPCQAFSVAGQRRGFDETRGTLFFDIARIVADKRPRHMVLENVKGLLNHQGGETFQTILGVLTELGYDVEWQLFNSKDWGVPQNRERVYIIGHLRADCRSKILPISPEIRRADSTSQPEQQGSESFIKTRHLSQNGTLISPSITLQASEIPHIIDRKRIQSQTARGVKKVGYTGAIETRPDLIVDGIRRLTPVECERLQGFPDNWTTGSDHQRYKQCGNAVTTNVVVAVMQALKPCLEG